MKKFILPLMSIAILMAMASCSSSDDAVTENNAEVKLVPMTFTATQETNAGTRAALDNSYNVNWQENDAISVFDGTDAENNHKFTLTGSVAEGKFSGTASSTATSYTAVYPYTSGAQLNLDGSVSGITLLAEQKAIDNSFDPAAALMMAVSTGENKNKLDFKNAVSLVKIKTEFACKKIVLTANEDIAGAGKLTYNSGAPSIAFESKKSKSITLKPATDGENIAVGTYYIVVPPTTLSGFSISFTASQDYNVYTRTSTQSNTFTRSKIKDFGTFQTTGNEWTWSHTSRGDKVKASQEVDLGLTITKSDGKKYRVIFANANLTTTGLANNKSDYGDYFAWGATEPWYDSLDRTASPWTVNWKPDKSDGYKDTNCPSYNNDAVYVENGILKMEYDAAHKILKGGWQIPTKAIWEALVGINSKKWNNTKQGYEFTNNSQTLFLPAAGQVYKCRFDAVSTDGYYWSGTANSNTNAYRLTFQNSSVGAEDSDLRYYGLSVRPVRLVAE